jgi:hypothetical protein
VEGGSIQGKFLPNNITETTISADGNRLTYLLPTDDGISASTVDIRTNITNEVLKNGYREWLPYTTTKGLFLATKPSANVPGYLYRYDQKEGGFERILRNKNGLVVLPRADGERVLFSENLANTLVFGMKGYNKVNDEGDALGDEQVFSISTIPDKCVWSSDGVGVYCQTFSLPKNAVIPDDWYQGLVSLTGSFWKLNTQTDEIERLADPGIDSARQFDAYKLSLSADEKTLYFINKPDGQLWGMHIVHPVTGDESVPLQDLKDVQGSVR